MGFKYINQMSHSDNLNQFLELVDLAAGSGKDVNNAFDLSERLHNSRPMKVCLQAIQKEPSCLQMLTEKYVGPLYDLNEMLKMPKGSLGWTYGTVMTTLGYDPQFYRIPEKFETDADYVTFRVYKTHDIHHILTGYSLDDMGELGVISVTVAQIGYPGFIFLDLSSFLFKFLMNDKMYNEQMPPEEKNKTLSYAFDLVSSGLKMGEIAKPLFPVKWEENLEYPLEELREMLNIKPVKTGAYSWYSRPELQKAIA